MAEIGNLREVLEETANRTFLPLLDDESRYLVLMGGAGSGKSVFAGSKVLYRAATEPGHRWLVTRKVARTMRESCYRQLVSQAAELGIEFKTNKTDMSIRLENGSEIVFAGLDDVEKLKSIYNITGIWCEEASDLTSRDFDQLDIRLRGETPYYKQIILTFNPVSVMHWLKRRFFDETEPCASVHRSTYRDNRYLDAAAVEVLEKFRDTDPYYYQVYCLGEWGVTGKTIFDAQAVSERLAQNIRPAKTGTFLWENGGYVWRDDPDGLIKIYREPEDGVPYVIGGDTAGTGSDFFVGQVLDNRDGSQAAVLRHRFDSVVYAKQMYALGMYYNRALIGIEENFDLYPILELERMGYTKQYVRQELDTYTHLPKNSYGFRTTGANRETIISNLVQVMRDEPELVSDRDTLEEMLTFVRSERLRAEAQAGAHDDCIMALAIAHYIRPQQRYTRAGTDRCTAAWTEDMWEDYNRASRAEKVYLLEKWGK